MALQPYTKQQWVDHQVDEATSEIIVLGTPADKIHFDHLEDGIQTADARAIEALGGVEALQLPVADNTKARHTHGNKGVLDGITAALVAGWNGAVNHITDAVKHITAAERSLWNTVSSKADAAKVSEELSHKANQNILRNGNFIDPVNQRGQTNYANTGASIDGWIVDLNGGTAEVSVLDGFLRIKQNSLGISGSQSIRQAIEKPESLSGKTVTLSIMHRGTGTAGMIIFSNESMLKSAQLPASDAWVSDAITVTLPAKPANMSIWLCADMSSGLGYTDFQWAKLECGTTATTFVPRSYGEELALCQRYLIALPRYILFRASRQHYNDNFIECSLTTPVPMRTCPTIVNSNALAISSYGCDLVVGYTYMIAAYGNGYLRLRATAPSGATCITDGTLECGTASVLLDAEIY